MKWDQALEDMRKSIPYKSEVGNSLKLIHQRCLAKGPISRLRKVYHLPTCSSSIGAEMDEKRQENW